jgi:hypothetical protein
VCDIVPVQARAKLVAERLELQRAQLEQRRAIRPPTPPPPPPPPLDDDDDVAPSSVVTESKPATSTTSKRQRTIGGSTASPVLVMPTRAPPLAPDTKKSKKTKASVSASAVATETRSIVTPKVPLADGADARTSTSEAPKAHAAETATPTANPLGDLFGDASTPVAAVVPKQAALAVTNGNKSDHAGGGLFGDEPDTPVEAMLAVATPVKHAVKAPASPKPSAAAAATTASAVVTQTSASLFGDDDSADPFAALGAAKSITKPAVSSPVLKKEAVKATESVSESAARKAGDAGSKAGEGNSKAGTQSFDDAAAALAAEKKARKAKKAVALAAEAKAAEDAQAQRAYVLCVRFGVLLS